MAYLRMTDAQSWWWDFAKVALSAVIVLGCCLVLLWMKVSVG